MGQKRWIVDGMNLIGSRPDKWWNDPKRAMRDLVSTIEEYSSQTGDEVMVVFDTDPGPLPAHEEVDVVVARRRGRNAADYEIEQIVSGKDDLNGLRVVTSDRRLAETVRSLGADVVGAGTFRNRLDRTL